MDTEISVREGRNELYKNLTVIFETKLTFEIFIVEKSRRFSRRN